MMDSLEIQLMEAVRSSKIDVVKSLLEKGANVNYIPACGKSPLSTAASSGNIPLMRTLIAQEDLREGCDTKFSSNEESKHSCHSRRSLARKSQPCVEQKQNLGYYIFVHGDDPGSGGSVNENLDAETPEGMESLEWDVECELGRDHEEEVSGEDVIWANQYKWYASILDRTGGLTQERDCRCDLDLQDNRGRTALHYVSEHSQLDALDFLVSAGCKVDIGDVDAVTPLHLAAMRDHREVAELLLAAGANVNRKTADKMAPLHYAAVRGLEEMVALLLKAGAAIDTLDANDRTPLLLAVTRDHLETVRLLVSHGAKVNIEEIHGYTPLCEAVWNKSVEVASLLLDAGAKLTQSPYLLHYTALHRHTQMAQLLLVYGAYPNVRDDQGDTPLLVAVTCGHIPTIKLLLQYDANPNYGNSVTEVTPLVEALTAWDCNQPLLEEILRLLCAYNVNLNMPGRLGSSPLFHCVCNRRWRSAEALVRAGADVNNYMTNLGNSWPATLDIAVAHHSASGALCYLLVAAGYDMSKYKLDYPKDFTKIDTSSLPGWLTYKKFNPRSLMDICRISIRSQMGNKTLFLIPSLEIPQSLKQYLLLKDIFS